MAAPLVFEQSRVCSGASEVILGNMSKSDVYWTANEHDMLKLIEMYYIFRNGFYEIRYLCNAI